MKYLPLDDLTHWRGSAGSFIFFLASNVTHIALDTHAAPKAHMSDGCIDLIIIRKSTRVQMAKVLTALVRTNSFGLMDRRLTLQQTQPC
jgi:diacylglycerol kinase family enzyme